MSSHLNRLTKFALFALQGTTALAELTQHFAYLPPASGPTIVSTQIRPPFRPLLDPLIPLPTHFTPQHGSILLKPPGSSL